MVLPARHLTTGLCEALGHPATGASSKLERLAADLDEVAASGQKAIVFSQWVGTLERLGAALAYDLKTCAEGSDRHPRPHAQKGVPSNAFQPHNALQQEPLLSLREEFAEREDGRQMVGQEGAIDGNSVALPGEGEKVVSRRLVHGGTPEEARRRALLVLFAYSGKYIRPAVASHGRFAAKAGAVNHASPQRPGAAEPRKGIRRPRRQAGGQR